MSYLRSLLMTLRACYDIKEGEEITINYRAGKRLFSMRKRETRQKLLLQAMDFNCSCHFCEKQCDPTRESNMAEKKITLSSLECTGCLAQF